MGAKSDPAAEENPLASIARYRRIFGGVLVAAVGFTLATANDAVAFGSAYLANPDPVERFARGYPLAVPDPVTIYGDGPQGYTDYPAADPA